MAEASHKRGPESPAVPQHAAGEFSYWLRATRRSGKLRVIGADVPCGTCTACCRSSYFIHIRPDEKATSARIPKRLLFQAPGLPKGHLLMGYNERGECPMFVDNRCSIYEHRPQTCRDYDCRIFAATGLEQLEAQSAIAEQVRTWAFSYPTAIDLQEFDAVRAAGAFLQHQRAYFPPDALPAHPAQLAALAVEVHQVFLRHEQIASEHRSSAEIAKAVLEAMEQSAAPCGQRRK